MRKHRGLLTRQAILDAESLVYDYEPIRRRFWDYARERRAAGEQAFYVPRELMWELHEHRHGMIDVLAGIDSGKRLPGDTISDAVFANLITKAEGATKEIIEHTTKFIAHASSPDSRAVVQADDATITLSHLWSAHEQLCQVAAFVAIYILGDSCPGFLATPQSDQFRYIDKPLVDTSHIMHLETLWRDYEGDCHAWSLWGLKEYAEEFAVQTNGKKHA